MKKFWITILSVLMLVTSVAFVAACDSCGGDVLTNYVLSESGSLVEDDFILPLTVNDKKVEWKSNSDAIVIEQRDEDYLAKVNLGDEAQAVELTVSRGKESKTFEVTVAAFDVHYFASKYVFKQNDATIFEAFDLDTTFTIDGKTANISWSVRKADEAYIKISEDGKKCLIIGTPSEVDVRISATFSYKGSEHTVPYRMKATFKREHLEEVDYWYMNTGVSITMSGYVVAIATEYSSQFGNVSLYMVDDDFCAGYYIYRVGTDAESGNALEPGVHVTVTGTKNTNYNGLVETNQGGNLVVDKDVAKINVNEKVYALDNDLMAGAPSAIYNTSRIVSLDKWAVKSVAQSAPEAGVTATLFTLSKGGVDVTVAVSKYLEGAYRTKAGDATWEGLSALQGTIKVGDVVSVKGVLGNYKGYQLMPLSAADVKVETVAATEPAPELAKAKTAISAVKTLMNKETSNLIMADKTITLPATDGVVVTCELVRPSDAVSIVDGKIVVKVGDENTAVVKITYSVGEAYKTVTFHTIRSQKLSDSDVVAKVKFDLALGKTEITPADKLPLTNEAFPGVKITWALKEAVEGVTINGNMVVNTGAEDKNVVLVASITFGEASDTKEIQVKALKVVKEWDLVSNASTLKAGDVLLFAASGKAMGSQGNNFRNKVDDFDGFTTPKGAETVTLEAASEGKFYLKVSDGYLTAPNAETKSNHIYTKAEKATDGTSEWTITIVGGVVTLQPTTTSEGRTLAYNVSSPRFACYKPGSINGSSIVNISIYIKIAK